MKPRNAIQRRIVELSENLPQREGDKEKIMAHYKRHYKGVGLSYYCISERAGDWQVSRYFYVTSRSFFECVQVFTKEGEKYVLAKPRFFGVDNWIRKEPITLKNWGKYTQYSYCGDDTRIPICETFVRSATPELRLRGVRRTLHGISPSDLFCGETSIYNNFVESLYKQKQFVLANFICTFDRELSDYEKIAIRVAVRHGFKFTYKNTRRWFDTIGMIHESGNDVHNPIFVAPADLDAMHERMMLAIEAAKARKQRQEEKALAALYIERRKRFFDMLIADGNLTIRCLRNMGEFIVEGQIMHHCVNAGRYWDLEKHPYSLILSACVNGKKTETIEVNLRTYKISQCYGEGNTFTEHHDRIKRVVEQNMSLIRYYNQQKPCAKAA